MKSKVLKEILTELKAIRLLLTPSPPVELSVEVDGEELEARVRKIADGVRVEAARRPGLETQRLYT